MSEVVQIHTNYPPRKIWYGIGHEIALAKPFIKTHDYEPLL